MKLAQLLGIEPGVTAVIGGGGKTTLLQVLGEELSQKQTVLLCTTTKIFPFPDLPCAKNAEELGSLRQAHRLICAGKELSVTGKLAAPEVPMAQLAAWFDYVLVEADGSAQRPLKAHAPHEPVIPVETNQTICVVGASGFGRPIAEAAHRPELYARLAGVTMDETATPETEAAVLLMENIHNIIYVNQVETLSALADAKALGALVKCPVLAGSLRRGEYFQC